MVTSMHPRIEQQLAAGLAYLKTTERDGKLYPCWPRFAEACGIPEHEDTNYFRILRQRGQVVWHPVANTMGDGFYTLGD